MERVHGKSEAGVTFLNALNSKYVSKIFHAEYFHELLCMELKRETRKENESIP
jgi:hypothetical protein